MAKKEINHSGLGAQSMPAGKGMKLPGTKPGKKGKLDSEGGTSAKNESSYGSAMSRKMPNKHE